MATACPKFNSCILTYLDLQQKYELKYGSPTILFMQIGDFYEMYEYDPACCQEEKDKVSRHRSNYVYNANIGHVIDVALILGEMVVTQQNSNKPYSIDNPYKAGFPIRAYDQKRRMLLHHGYVIVRIDQIEARRIGNYRSDELIYVNRKSEARRVAEVSSRATSMDMEPPSTGTNNVVSIYIEYQKGHVLPEDFVLTCGVSCIDVTTGINRVCELQSKNDNRGAAIQEITRFLLAQQPREVVVNINNLPTDDKNYPGTSTSEDSDSGVSSKSWVNIYSQFIMERLELHRCTNHVILVNKVDPEYSKLAYQAQFLQRVFFSKVINEPTSASKMETPAAAAPAISTGQNQIFTIDFSQVPNPNSQTNSISSVVEQPIVPIQMSQPTSHEVAQIDRGAQIKLLHNNSLILSKLGLENMPYGRISYLLLLQYCYEHSPYLIKRIKRPENDWIDSKKHLILAHNAIKQLNISPEHGFNYRSTGKHTSLFEVVNFTSTRMGYRLLRERLFNPLLDVIELNQSYQQIADIQKLQIANTLTEALRGIPDVDCYQRKLLIQTLKPRELLILYNAYSKVASLYSIISGSTSTLKKVLFVGTDIEQFNEFLQTVYNTFNLDQLKDCKIVSSNDKSRKVMDFVSTPIKLGADPNLDRLVTTISSYEQALQSICDHLNTFLARCRGEKLSYHRKQKDKKKQDRIVDIDVVTTPAKARTLEINRANIDVNLCGQVKFETFHSQRRVTSERISSLIDGLKQCKDELRTKVYDLYYNLMELMSKYEFYSSLSQMVASIDFAKSACLAANKYKYYRPELVEGNGSPSFLSIKGLRHPVIERIIDQPYITNDLQLGNGSNRGLLVYGANSTGKSSLARATALAVIMAQAGMYTACQITLRPFHRIFTRISGNDDIIKGMSSFVVEMYEMRIFDREANDRSLILGDEPCRGTERYSGAGIALTAIERLIDKNSCFIFATHMHDMLKLDSFGPLHDKLQISHLNMYYDSEVSQLVIDRKLKQGSGPTIYGIEVAKSLDFEDDFIRRALEIRAEATKESNQILPPVKSRYNSAVYKDRCAVCNGQNNLHTHHLQEQRLADEQGFIGDMDKNVGANLVTLCQDCHHKVHHEQLSLKNVQTISGSALIVEQ